MTPESRARRGSYRAEAVRASEFEAAGGDYLAFLRSSDIRLDVAALAAPDVTRVHELSQRTNQLNFTGAKLGREAVDRLAKPSPGHERLVLRCADRFGDYGLIGFADLDLQRGEMREFFMSCRVQRKRVEHAFFARASQSLADRGHATFKVRFRPTERNGAAVQMLAELGFARGETDAEGWSVWTRPTSEPIGDHDVVRLAQRPPEAA